MEQPIYHTIGPEPSKPPFKVDFVIFGGNGPNEANLESIEQKRTLEVMLPMYLKAKKRCMIHLSGSFWVLPGGMLVKRRPFLDLMQVVSPKRDFTLRIDFDFEPTFQCSLEMPAKAGRIVELNSGYPCERWKLCLSRQGYPGWHDHLLFEDGSFYLESVLLGREVQST